MSQFVELSLDGIEEGRFLREGNDELQKMQTALLEHIRRYGEEITAGCQAELTMKVIIKSAKDASGAFSITTKVNRKEPGRPNTVTLAVQAPSQTGDGQALHMPRSGTNDDPDQLRLSTADGREIDSETGKPTDN